MIKHFIKGTALLTALIIGLTGCNLSRDDIASETDATKMSVITDINKLKNHSFYIRHKDEYYPLYLGEKSFEIDETSINTDPSDERTLFFKDDWDMIPTCFKNDTLVYYCDDKLPDYFILERFEDVGYSFGICNLKLNPQNNLYYFETTTSDEEVNPNIYQKSNFSKIQELYPPESIISINSLGKDKLEIDSNQISRGGIILGLEKDNLYTVTVAKGSDPMVCEFLADTKMLTSWEILDISTRFNFSETKTIEFDFPNYMENGYYMINGKGLFRYVNGKTYNEGTTGVNIPTMIPEQVDEEEPKRSHKKIKSNTADTYPFVINDKGDYVLKVTLGESDSNQNLAEPNVKLITDDGALPFTNDGNNVYSLETALEPGKYNIEITQLLGREIKSVENARKKEKKSSKKKGK